MRLIKKQVVRRGLTGDVKPLGLGPADQLNALLGGDVANVVGASRFADQFQVARDGPPFTLGADALVSVRLGVFAVVNVAAVSEKIVLAVGDDDLAEALGLAHGGLHHLLGLHAAAVVRKAGHERCECLHVGKLLAALLLRDGTQGANVDQRALADGLQLGGEMLGRIGHGIEVWHGANAGVAAVRRRKRPGPDRLLIRKSRLAEMYVNIHKTGENINVLKLQKRLCAQGILGDRSLQFVKRQHVHRGDAAVLISIAIVQANLHVLMLLPTQNCESHSATLLERSAPGRPAPASLSLLYTYSYILSIGKIYNL